MQSTCDDTCSYAADGEWEEDTHLEDPCEDGQTDIHLEDPCEDGQTDIHLEDPCEDGQTVSEAVGLADYRDRWCGIVSGVTGFNVEYSVLFQVSRPQPLPYPRKACYIVA